MPTAAQNLSFVRGGIDELENYLPSDILYWPLKGDNNLPRLTPGGLLLGLIRLQMGQNSVQESVPPDTFNTKLDIIRTKWRSAWEKKGRQEIHARLDLWKNYLIDYHQSPELHGDLYPQQVQWRVILQLLANDMGFLPHEGKLLDGVDEMVKSSWLPGDFIWEPELIPAFPEPEYWFLYGKLKP